MTVEEYEKRKKAARQALNALVVKKIQESGQTPERLAKRLGISSEALRRYRRKSYLIHSDTLLALMRELGITWDELKEIEERLDTAG